MGIQNDRGPKAAVINRKVLHRSRIDVHDLAKRKSINLPLVRTGTADKHPPRLRSLALVVTGALLEEGCYEIKNIFPVHTKYATGTSAISVDAVGSDTGNNVAVTQKVGSPRITKTGAARICVI